MSDPYKAAPVLKLCLLASLAVTLHALSASAEEPASFRFAEQDYRLTLDPAAPVSDSGRAATGACFEFTPPLSRDQVQLTPEILENMRKAFEGPPIESDPATKDSDETMLGRVAPGLKDIDLDVIQEDPQQPTRYHLVVRKKY